MAAHVRQRPAAQGPEAPLAFRLLIVAVVTATAGVFTSGLLMAGAIFESGGSLAITVGSLAIVVLLAVIASAVWYRMLPKVRWLGLPVVVAVSAIGPAYLSLFG